MGIVEIKKLVKTYHLEEIEIPVLRGLDVEFSQGQYIAVMGPSGSGKSTFLNLLGCLDRPTSGEYILDGNDVSRLDDDSLSEIRGKKIGFIFQSFNLIQQLNVIENICVPMFYQGVDEDVSTKRALELVKMVGLESRIYHRPSQLSGGQQQRVAIARALVNDPVVLLADEPTGNLDSKSGTEILQILDNLHGQGKTLVIVTHDPNVAARAERVIHFLDGVIDTDKMN